MQGLESVLFFLAILVVYWLPSLIAILRKVNGIGQVLVVNFFAWFLVFPWVIALVMAFRSDTEKKTASV